MSIQQEITMTLYEVKRELGVEGISAGDIKTSNGVVHVTSKYITETTDKGMWTYRKHEK